MHRECAEHLDSARESQSSMLTLMESEERLQRALDATGLCLWDFDVPSGDVYLSEAWSVRLGGAAITTCTTFAALAELVPVNERSTLLEALHSALRSPETVYSVEHRVRKLDGTMFWNLSEGKVVERDASGRALRMVGTNRDITPAKQAEALQQNLEAQLRESQRMEAIGTLAAGIAHDFNNILGAVLGNVALARDDVGTGHPALASLDQINKASLRARKLVRQILAFARHQPFERNVRSLSPIVEESVTMLRASLPTGVYLCVSLGKEELNVSMDSTQVQQVLVNLCTNAWHAMPDGAGRIDITLERLEFIEQAGSHAGPHALLCVRDDGRGMDTTTMARIFEPFYTTKTVGHGTGLGLSVVHGIVRAHDGFIEVKSELGRGSCFEVFLPLANCISLAESSVWGDDLPFQRIGSRQAVAYVDDDEVLGLLAQRILGRLGYAVTYFQNPDDAVRNVLSDPQRFDALVSDYNMPGLTGLELLRHIASARADLPIAITSGYLSDDQRSALLRAGARFVFPKEETSEQLGAVVARLLS